MLQWRDLTSESQLDEILALSDTLPVAIFKHSTRCSRSAHAKYRLEKDWTYPETDMPAYYLDLLEYRNISDAVARVTGVSHQSPQLIILRNRQVVYSASHESISVEKIAV